jgi:hypothetical protein
MALGGWLAAQFGPSTSSEKAETTAHPSWNNSLVLFADESLEPSGWHCRMAFV